MVKWKQRHKRMYKFKNWICWAIAALVILCLLTFGATWLLSLGHIISVTWSYIFAIAFVLFGVIFAFLQWIFPLSPLKFKLPRFPLAHELVRESFGMGDDGAANFPYTTAPIQDAYDTAIQGLLDASSGTSNKHGILILGEANAGKTGQ